MKKINIFLASSITEFANERMEIENFIRNVSDEFEEHYGIKLQPLLCENFDDAVSEFRKQEEYNEKIRNSELCFFIFFTKAGEYTREEFAVAREKFIETGKPKIYTYFKVIHDEKPEQSLYDFMEELDKIIGHYYGSFEHLDTVKLRILLSLKLQEMDFVEIKTADSKFVVDGKAIMSIDNVAEFANNQTLTRLQRELEEVETEYYQMKPLYAQDKNDASFYKKYSEIAARRQNLIDEIEELQKLIFNVSMRMVTDEIHGEITVRQKEAYRLFELGDYDGCMKILDFEEINNDFLTARKRIKEQDTAVCRKYIKEHKTAIDILEAMTGYTKRFSEIEARYEKIVPITLEERIELNVVCDYVFFLKDQNRTQRAAEVAQALDAVYASQPDVCDAYDKAWLYNAIASICMDLNQPQKSEEYYLKAIEIREALARDNPERYNGDLADSYNNAGVFYKDQGQTEKAEEYYLKAIEIYEALARDNPERYNGDLARSYNNAGVFYQTQEKAKSAEEHYRKAIEIREALARDNPEKYNGDLAASYNNAGVFYKDQGQTEKAEEYYLKAIEIYEALARDNPERYNSDLAVSYLCLASHKKEIIYFARAYQLAKTATHDPRCRRIVDVLGEYFSE